MTDGHGIIVCPATGTERKEPNVCYSEKLKIWGWSWHSSWNWKNRGESLQECKSFYTWLQEKQNWSTEVFGNGQIKLRGFEAGGSLEFLPKKGSYLWPKQEERALQRDFQI